MTLSDNICYNYITYFGIGSAWYELLDLSGESETSEFRWDFF